MRKIIKGSEPASLTRWKRTNPTKKYSDLTGEIRQDIRAAIIEEQHHICAYCCQSITPQTTTNEHVTPQHHAPNKTLDFNNIVASCKTQNRCDHAHGSALLSLTPLMKECETELKFRLSGRVEGLTNRATEMIEILNLTNNRGLKQQRKNAIDAILFEHQINDPATEDDAILKLLIGDLQNPDSDNKLDAFAPVLVNVLKSFT